MLFQKHAKPFWFCRSGPSADEVLPDETPLLPLILVAILIQKNAPSKTMSKHYGLPSGVQAADLEAIIWTGFKVLMK